MAKRIVISVIGAAPLNEDRGTGQAAVDRMIEHWRRKLDLVLPDRPDLIVVPECCDRYAGWTVDQALAYGLFVFHDEYTDLAIHAPRLSAGGVRVRRPM